MRGLLDYFTLRRIDLMRMVVGILISLNGYPLIFFFKESLRLAPGSTAFTAAFLGLGYLLMIPTTIFRKLYRCNPFLLKFGVVFLIFSIISMYVYPATFFDTYTQDMLYYLYIFVFLFLLINIPNDIIEVFIPITVAFAVVSNLALVYALLTDPTWTIGSRAAIQYGEGEYRTGNPHVFARNALICVVACGIWVTQPKTNFLARIFALFSGVFSMGILVLTQVRSSILALGIIIFLFLFFNVRPAQIKSLLRQLVRPASLVILGLVFIGISYFIRRNYDLYAVLYGYAVAFIERNMENVYAVFGLKASDNFSASLDASASNRATSFLYLRILLEGHLNVILYGQGYKSVYLDVPLLEALVNHGFVGFVIFACLILSMLVYSLKAMRDNPDPLSTFLAYFYIYMFVQMFTVGRPYEMAHWQPLCMMIRFIGIDHLFPARLLNRPPKLAPQLT
ncbi:hypothetical protein ACFQ4C_19840 [Larkinella insperata]|uniref:O-antigen ligase domain-containing protein n=1 Tax=Larkinella insperata TaxID=332158 RepID=A0ABW3QG49_9BACT|nr:hypothetical protein [Larkinella insperata]